MRKMIAEELSNSIHKLEKFTILEVPPQVVYEVAGIVAIAAKRNVKVDCIDRTLNCRKKTTF